MVRKHMCARTHKWQILVNFLNSKDKKNHIPFRQQRNRQHTDDDDYTSIDFSEHWRWKTVKHLWTLRGKGPWPQVLISQLRYHLLRQRRYFGVVKASERIYTHIADMRERTWRHINQTTIYSAPRCQMGKDKMTKKHQ